MARMSFFMRPPDLLVFVGINQRADAFVGKHFRQQRLIHPAVDDVDPRHAGLAGGGGVVRLGKNFGRETAFVVRQQRIQIGHQNLLDQPALINQAVHAS